jgi:hypothetical protein
MATKEITAADIAKELGVKPATARLKLRAVGIRAPYAEKDVPKMKAIIKGDAPTKDAKRKAPKPKGRSSRHLWLTDNSERASAARARPP